MTYSLANFPGYAPGVQVRVVQPEGNGTSRILVVGEAPGEHEEKDGLPFRPYAEAGSVLQRALHRAGIPRESLTLANVVWYRPPRNWLDGAPWEYDAIRACRPLLDELVRKVQPKVIVALGGLALRELTGLSGAKAGISMVRGFVCRALNYCGTDGNPLPVVGSYHPSFLRRGSKDRQETGPKGKTEALGGGTQGMGLLGVLIRDLRLAQEVAQGKVPAFGYDDYKLGATVGEWEDALTFLHARPELLISYDFETQDSLVTFDESEVEAIQRDVTQVQISWQVGQAVVSEWTPELQPILKSILELPNPKIDWNGRKFDRPILRDMGIRTNLDVWHDGMDLWHHSQPDLPRGLQYAASFACPESPPWKHTSQSDPLWYGALDVDMPQRIFAHLHKSMQETKHPISGVSLCEGYTNQVVRVAPVLDRMSARGIAVDEEKRLALDAEFTATLDRIEVDSQPLFPDVLRSCVPKKGYVREPDEVLQTCPACGGKKKIKLPGTKKSVPCVDCGGRGKLAAIPPPGFVRRTFEDEVKCECGWAGKKKTPEVLADCLLCGNTGKRVESVERWCRLEPFLPGSWQQVLRYLEYQRGEDIRAWHEKALAKGHPEARKWAMTRTDWKIPIDHKTGKPSTAEAGLTRLNAKVADSLIALILEYREIDKARGTYVRGWKPGKDGKVHPNFGFKPATGQLSSDNPNAQNYPSHGILAQKMKAMIVSTADGDGQC